MEVVDSQGAVDVVDGGAEVLPVGNNGVKAYVEIVGQFDQRGITVLGRQCACTLVGLVPEVESGDPGDLVGGLAFEGGKHSLLMVHMIYLD